MWRTAKRKLFTAKRYPPGAPETVELFKAAAIKGGLPLAWASDPDLHYILKRESGGWVGRPNYTYGKAHELYNQDQWPAIWAELKQRPDLKILPKSLIRTKSTATGLGQLLSSNAAKFYPSGRQGIGNALEEAVGYMKYIRSRYGSPQAARSVYNRKGWFVHAVTGKKTEKTFREGY